MNQLPVAQITDEQGKNVFVEIDTIRHRRRYQYVDSYVPSNSALGSAFAQGTNIDVFLTSPSITFLKNMWIQLTVANSDMSNTADLVNAPFLFNYIEIYVGGDRIYTVYPEQMWQYLGLYRVEETALLAGLANWDPATYESSTNGIIAANSSATYYIEFQSVFSQLNIPMTFLNNSVRLRFGCSNNILTSTSVVTNVNSISLNQLQVFTSGDRIEALAYGRLDNQLRSGIHRWTGYQPDQYTSNLGTLASGAQFSVPLASTYGYMAGATFYIRNSAGTNENRYQMDNMSLYKLNNITLYNASGVAYQVQGNPDPLLRLALAKDYTPSEFWLTFFNYSYKFSDVLLDSILNGRLDDVFMSNNWRFVATAPAIASTNAELVMITWKRVICELDPRGAFRFAVATEAN